MELQDLERVLIRLRPFVRDGVIRRSRLERVLGTLEVAPDDTRKRVEGVLAQARIRIDEDGHTQSDPSPTPPGSNNNPNRTTEGDRPEAETADRKALDARERSLAVEAARLRIARDREVANHASILLSAQQEVGLATLIRGDSGLPLEKGAFRSLSGEARAAAECLFLHNQRLVHSIARRYPQSGMNYEDIVQHGMAGLIRAVELFDPEQGNKFSTYATWWIRQAITRGIANDARLIRLPVHMVEKLTKVWAVRARLMLNGDTPTIRQLSRACELDEKVVLDCLRLGPPDLPSLDMKIGDGETSLGDLLDKADPEMDPFRKVEYVQLQQQLSAILATLSEREAGVISMRFGLVTGDSMTLDEIGIIYDVSRERIRQIQEKTMKKLRHPSRSLALESFFYAGGIKPRPKEEPDDGAISPDEDLAPIKDGD